MSESNDTGAPALKKLQGPGDKIEAKFKMDCRLLKKKYKPSLNEIGVCAHHRMY